LLIILDHSDGIQNDMGPCAEVVMQAAEHLVILGKERAANSTDNVCYFIRHDKFIVYFRKKLFNVLEYRTW